MAVFKVKDLMVQVGPEADALRPNCYYTTCWGVTVGCQLGTCRIQTVYCKGWTCGIAASNCGIVTGTGCGALSCITNTLVECAIATLDITTLTRSALCPPDTTVTIEVNPGELATTDLAQLKDQLKAQLARVEAVEAARRQAAQVPATIEEATALEAKLSEALDEVRAHRASLEKKG